MALINMGQFDTLFGSTLDRFGQFFDVRTHLLVR
jgi:hypothetical protein